MTFKQLLAGLTVTFGLPWLVLVVLPYVSMAHLKPVAYGEDEEMKGTFPPALASTEARGQETYFDEGCAQCHTQVIRAQYASGDGDEFKKGWGAEQNKPAPVRTRQTAPHDYLGESFAAIGLRRLGPDLANAGYRFSTRQEVLQHLYDPRVKNPWSICPSHRHLFRERKILGQVGDENIRISKKMEWVPRDEALALADYILALKRDYPLPASMAGSASKPAAPATAAPAPAATPGTPGTSTAPGAAPASAAPAPATPGAAPPVAPAAPGASAPPPVQAAPAPIQAVPPK
ncbi:MAG: hypothetical protein ACR2OZ_19975 [Verrucomicrobiales bacterium]